MAALRARGVDWLAPSDAAGEPLDDAALIAGLAAHPDPRLRQALTALFLLRPGLAAHVAALHAQLEGQAADELQARYMAAVYLQHFWLTRLSFYQDEVLPLPDLFSKSLGLPVASAGFGKPGLHKLAEWHMAHSASPFNRLAEYNQIAEHTFTRLEAEAKGREPAFAG